MSELKCPFCQQELVGEGSDNYWCKKCNLERHIPALYGSQKLWEELIRTRKENEDKQAVLNCIVDMLKTLSHRYALIFGKDVIKETVRLLEQKEE